MHIDFRIGLKIALSSLNGAYFQILEQKDYLIL